MNADTIRAAITTIRYELAPSAIEAMGVSADVACDVFGDALLEVYPNASVTVRRANIDGCSMEARGETDDGDEVVITRRHFGGATVLTDEGYVSSDVERAIDADDQDVWERACKRAEGRA